MTLRGSAFASAFAAAGVFVVYGLLLQRLSDRQPPSPGANPAIAEGLRVLFWVVGVFMAALYAWRYVSVARAATAGTLGLRHRRQLRKARRTAIWAAFVLVLVCAAVTRRSPDAAPMAVACLVVALVWVAAAVLAVRAERDQPADPPPATGAAL